MRKWPGTRFLPISSIGAKTKEVFMKKVFLFVIVLGLMSLSSASVLGAPAAAGCAGETLNPAALDAMVASELKAKGLVGLSLAVASDGKIVLVKGYGTGSLESGAATTAETAFAIGSITKQFTCACILKLAEEGKLAVEDRVAKYYPNLSRAEDITLLDLMNHVSGYSDYYPLDFVDRRMLKTIEPDELIRRYAGGKLDFEPGSRYSYSNTGYIILGRIVEKVSGQAFGQFLKEQILNPFGLNHTFYEPAPEQAGLARGHTSFALGEPETATPEAGGWISSAGALYSTAADLAAWDLALISGQVLNPNSFALMTKARTLNDGRISMYGCGLSIGMRNGRPVLSHNGAVAGFYAQNIMAPSTRSAVILLSNLDNSAAVNAIWSKILAAVFPSDVPHVPAIAGLPIPEAHKMMLLSFEAGKADRRQLGEEFNWFLTEEKIRGASQKLKAYGEPSKVEIESVSERGGMEVSRVRFVFAASTLKGLMYRTPDGKIQQFFVLKE